MAAINRATIIRMNAPMASFEPMASLLTEEEKKNSHNRRKRGKHPKHHVFAGHKRLRNIVICLVAVVVASFLH